MKEVNLNRIELHKLVWDESLPSLANKYYITYTELRKLCDEMNIPLPKNGYWQIKRLGRKVEVTPLPAKSLGVAETKLYLLEDGDMPKTSKKRTNKVEIEESNSNLAVPPSRPQKLGPMASEALGNLTKNKAEHSRYRNLVSTDDGIFNIAVSPKNVQRAIRFMDSLVKIFSAKSYEIFFKYQFTYVKIYEQEIRVSIKEMTTRTMVKMGTWETSDLVPNGLLSFRMGKPYNEVIIKDNSRTIEEQLPRIIERLETRAEKEKLQSEESAKWLAQYREEERLKKEAQLAKEKEIADFNKLIADAEKWHKSAIVLNYRNVVETNAIKNNSMSSSLLDWLSWARKRIDNYNPLTNFADEFKKNE